jgi:HSP20 family protein
MEMMPWRSRQISPLSSLQSEMNRMFEDFFNQPFGFPLQRTRMQAAVVPALDVREDEHGITVTAELPGIDAKDIEISVQDDVLEIRGQKCEEQKNEQENYYMVERSYGAFSRRVTLPAEVESEQAEASMNNGVLTLHLPKAQTKAGKKTISIQESSQQQAMGQQQRGQVSVGREGQVSQGASQGASQVSPEQTSSSQKGAGQSSRQAGSSQSSSRQPNREANP